MTFKGAGLLIVRMLTDQEKRIIASVQKDIPLSPHPYRDLAQSLGISEEALMASLVDLCERGVIRRFGATLRHQKSGFEANAMVAWQVDEQEVDGVGRRLADFREVSHCYRRNPAPNWPYNLYTMIHAGDEAACRDLALRMAQAVAIDSYTLLFSRQELKKISMAYFPTDDDD